jgi:hypothetical protein
MKNGTLKHLSELLEQRSYKTYLVDDLLRVYLDRHLSVDIRIIAMSPSFKINFGVLSPKASTAFSIVCCTALLVLCFFIRDPKYWYAPYVALAVCLLLIWEVWEHHRKVNRFIDEIRHVMSSN